MKFEWDENKSISNEGKHGIDFKSATELWNDIDRVEIQTSFPDEIRHILIGKIKSKVWVVVFTTRNDAIRIISVRRARKKEQTLYEQEK
jgi:uncharacterized DUF497 family protein